MKTTAKTLRGEDDTVDVYDFDAQITSATIQTTEKEEEEEEETAKIAARGTKKKKKSNATTTLTTTKGKPKAQQTKAKAKAITTTKSRSRLQNQGAVPPGDPRERPKETIALEFVKGPFKGTRFENPNNLPSLKIGRVKPGNQIHVKDDAVSQKHAHIFWNTETNQWVIVDLGSSNGTYVDDVELDEHSEASTLRNGSTIKIGNQTTVVVRIRPLEEEEERENAKKKKNNNKNNDNRNEEEEETELVKKKKKGTSKKSVGVATLEAKTKKMPLSASAKGNKKSVTLAGNGTKRTKRTSIRPEVTPSENDDENDNNNNNIADAATKKKKKKKEAKSPPLPLTKTAEEGEAGSRQRVNDDDEDDEKSNETTLERLQRWSSELIEDVRASAERAIERLFREKKKIEADLREEFAV